MLEIMERSVIRRIFFREIISLRRILTFMPISQHLEAKHLLHFIVLLQPFKVVSVCDPAVDIVFRIRV